jgi:hypothetical protein
MEPRIVLKHPKGDIPLCVTLPHGLVRDDDVRRENYCLLFIPADRATAIYRRMVPTGGEHKVEHILTHHFGVHLYEVPVLARSIKTQPFEVRNDAHVLAALVSAGVDPVPVVVHVADAADVASGQGL